MFVVSMHSLFFTPPLSRETLTSLVLVLPSRRDRFHPFLFLHSLLFQFLNRSFSNNYGVIMIVSFSELSELSRETPRLVLLSRDDHRFYPFLAHSTQSFFEGVLRILLPRLHLFCFFGHSYSSSVASYVFASLFFVVQLRGSVF